MRYASILLALLCSLTGFTQPADSIYLKARTQLKAGQYAAAATSLDKLLESNKTRAEIWRSRGVAHYHLQQWNEALNDLQQAAELHDESAEWFQYMGFTQFEKRDYESAAGNLGKALRGGAVSADVWLKAGEAQLALSHFTEALPLLQEAVTRRPDAAAYFARATARLGLKDEASALTDLDKALVQNGNFGPALQQRALLRSARKDWKGAAADWDKLDEQSPLKGGDRLQWGIALSHNGNATEAVRILKQPDLQDLLDQSAYEALGSSLTQLGDHAGARAAFAHLTLTAKDDKKLVEAVAQSLQNNGDWDAAMSTLALLGPSLSTNALVIRGVSAWHRGDKLKSRQDLEKAVAAGATHGEAFEILGHLAFERKEYSAAISWYNKSAGIQPAGAHLFLHRGLARRQLGEWDAALADFNQALQREPGLVAARAARGAVQFHRQQFAAAYEDLETDSHPADSANHLRMLALCKYELKEFDAAYLLLERAYAAGVKDESLTRKLAYLRYEHAQYTAALSLLRETPADAKDKRFYEVRGTAAYHAGNFKQAAADLTRSEQLGGGQALLWEHLGISLAALHQPAQALPWLKKAIAAGSKSGPVYRAVGNMEFEGGRMKEAVAALDSAVALGTTDAYAYLHRGIARYQLGQLKSALEDLNLSLQYKPDLADAYRWRARCNLRLQQWTNTIMDIAMTSAYSKLDAEDHAFSGAAKVELGQYAAAIEELNPATTGKASGVNIAGFRGLAWAGLSDWQKALPDLTAGLMREPSNATLLLNRGNAYFGLKQNEKACADWKGAAELGNEAAHALQKERCQ